MSDLKNTGDVTSVADSHHGVKKENTIGGREAPLDVKDQASLLEVVPDEAALFASPLPITGERKTTTRTELWVRKPYTTARADSRAGTSTMSATAVSVLSTLQSAPGRTFCISREPILQLVALAVMAVSHQEAVGHRVELISDCVLNAYGSTRSVNSIVLITNGISFALQAAIFLMMGSMADYGSWRPHITTFFTLLAWGVSFGWLGVMKPSKWQAGTALYILGLIGYQGALTFWTAAFPGLARDLPEMQRSEVELKEGQIE